MKTKGYLGIDLGTQGLSAMFTDQEMNVIEIGEGQYEMVPGLPEGCYEQVPIHWEFAVQAAATELFGKLKNRGIDPEVLAIGISGQMHGEVAHPLAPSARLWCDGRNQDEGVELTDLLGIKIPKRMTSARWLWSLRNRYSLGEKLERLTTPGGWLAHRLTGEWNLGIGDASGMFPIDQQTMDYDQVRMSKYDSLVRSNASTSWSPLLKDLLPKVRLAGEEAGVLNAAGARLLGLTPGIPVAPAEGDQPAALAGSLIGLAGTVSMSFGTSVCANSVGDRSFAGVSPAIDHFCAADGKPINMVFLRNGTTFMNSVIAMLGAATGKSRSEAFDAVIPQMLAAPADCEGVSALPFLDDEPGLGINRGGLGSFHGLHSNNCKPGNLAKAALLATIFNLRCGCDILSEQGFPRKEIILSGGLTKTPGLSQIIADVFRTPVRILESATEGSAWGAALLAKYRAACSGDVCSAGMKETWSEFLAQHQSGNVVQFQPDEQQARIYDTGFVEHCRLMDSIRI